MTKEEFAQLLNSKADYGEQLQVIRADAKHIGLVVIYDIPTLEEARKRRNGLEKAHVVTLKNDDCGYWGMETDLPHATFTVKDFSGRPCGEGLVIDVKDLQ